MRRLETLQLPSVISAVSCGDSITQGDTIHYVNGRRSHPATHRQHTDLALLLIVRRAERNAWAGGQSPGTPPDALPASHFTEHAP